LGVNNFWAKSQGGTPFWVLFFIPLTPLTLCAFMIWEQIMFDQKSNLGTREDLKDL
jgi:hypothetical protein